jgi:hypothetical protein
MRFLGEIFGRLVFCLGLMITVVACVIGSIAGSGGSTTMFGVTLITVGAVIYWVASTRVCPQCSQRIKHNAPTCKHCGVSMD